MSPVYYITCESFVCIILPDVDECSQNACPQNCTNTPGSYQCSCWRGYEFPVDCIGEYSEFAVIYSLVERCP